MLSADYSIPRSASARTSKPQPKSESAVSRRCHRGPPYHDRILRWGEVTPSPDAGGTMLDRFGPGVLSSESTRYGTLGLKLALSTLYTHRRNRPPEQGRTSRAKIPTWERPHAARTRSIHASVRTGSGDPSGLPASHKDAGAKTHDPLPGSPDSMQLGPAKAAIPARALLAIGTASN